VRSAHLPSTAARRATWGIDLGAVVLFVAIGRAAHRHGETPVGLWSTAWPFLVGLAVGWLVLRARRRTGVSLVDGAVVAVTTVGVGMLLRVWTGQGTAVPFIAVALGFLGAVMLGGRFVGGAIRSWCRAHQPTPPAGHPRSTSSP
jgi:hypothetical protein